MPIDAKSLPECDLIGQKKRIKRTTGDLQGLVMGGGLVIVQFLGINGLFSMQAIGLAGSKLL